MMLLPEAYREPSMSVEPAQSRVFGDSMVGLALSVGEDHLNSAHIELVAGGISGNEGRRHRSGSLQGPSSRRVGGHHWEWTSLNDFDLTRLKSENTIAVNGIFYAAERMGFDPTYYVVEDTAVMRDNLEEIVKYEAGHKFFPSMYRSAVGNRPGVTYFMMNRGFYEPNSPNFCIPRFSVDPTHNVYSGQSVTLINLQIAFHFGFEEVILIGMDFSYQVPGDAIVEGDLIMSTSGDPNHFHPEYFGPGKVWKDPNSTGYWRITRWPRRYTRPMGDVS